VIPLITHLTPSLLGDHTVFQLTPQLRALVPFLTLGTPDPIDLETALDVTHTSLELEVLHAIGTDASVVADTSLGDLLAFSLGGEVVAALAGDAAEFVVALAVGDLAVVVFLDKGVVAVLAHSIDLVLAAEDGVRETGVVDQTMA